MTRANSDSDTSGILKDSDRIAHGRKVLRAEAAALEAVAARLDCRFEQAIDMLSSAANLGAGRIAITGVGKSADVGQKIAGTFQFYKRLFFGMGSAKRKPWFSHYKLSLC